MVIAAKARNDQRGMSETNDPAPTLFQRIIDRQIPADIVHEDERCLAFRDIEPAAPLHVLVVPKKPIASLAAASTDDALLLGHLLVVAADVARREGHEAFRTVLNTGEAAGQTVFHLHVHVLAGREMSWPPG